MFISSTKKNKSLSLVKMQYLQHENGRNQKASDDQNARRELTSLYSDQYCITVRQPFFVDNSLKHLRILLRKWFLQNYSINPTWKTEGKDSYSSFSSISNYLNKFEFKKSSQKFPSSLTFLLFFIIITWLRITQNL